MLLKREEVKIMLLDCLKKYQERLGFKVYGYVVMDNHAHFLIQIKGDLSLMMQKFLLSFSRKYRMKNQYVGYFWQGRFKSQAVTTDYGMREVLDYVHENPVKAKIVKRVKDYIYSSAFKYLDFENMKVQNKLLITTYGDTSAGSCELLKL